MTEHREGVPDAMRETRRLAEERFPLPEEYLALLEERELRDHLTAYRKVLEVMEALGQAGGQALLIGGCVRDVIFGKISKDYDIEVYGLQASQIEEIVSAHGKVDEVGAKFGVLKLSFGQGVDVDISLPRTDSKVEEGHTGFDVKTDPNMSIEEAARRRDFTMNTVSADPFTGKINDPFGGVQDIKERRLRVTDEERFADDPLRVLRGIQFVGRFGLEIDPESMRIMQEMVPRLQEISKERILIEWEKLLHKSEKPSTGMMLSMALGSMRELHPDLCALQHDGESDHMPGVDRWMHMLMSVDEAAKIVRREDLSEKESFMIMITSVVGNLVRGDVAGGRASDPNEKLDLSAVDRFLVSIKADNYTKKHVKTLITSRHVPGQLYVEHVLRGNEVGDGQIRRLAKEVQPSNLRSLVLLAEADHMARGSMDNPGQDEDFFMPPDSFPAKEWLLGRARKLGVEHTKPTFIIEGRDWLAFGLKPGRHIGVLIALSNDLRDERLYTREMIFLAVDSMDDPGQMIGTLRDLLE